MADSTIYDLPALGARPAAGDRFALVDVSDTTDSADGSSKHCTFEEITGPVQVNETGDFQIDPDVHLHGSTIAISAATYPAARTCKLPALANQPAAGYRVVLLYDGSSSTVMNLTLNDDTTVLTAAGVIDLIYVGSNVWWTHEQVNGSLQHTNQDP